MTNLFYRDESAEEGWARFEARGRLSSFPRRRGATRLARGQRPPLVGSRRFDSNFRERPSLAPRAPLSPTLAIARKPLSYAPPTPPEGARAIALSLSPPSLFSRRAVDPAAPPPREKKKTRVCLCAFSLSLVRQNDMSRARPPVTRTRPRLRLLIALALLLLASAPSASPEAGSGGSRGRTRSTRALLLQTNFGPPAPPPRRASLAKLQRGAAALGTALRQNVLSFLLTTAKAPPPPPPVVVAAAAAPPAPPPPPLVLVPPAPASATLAPPPTIIVQTSTPVSVNNPINIDAGATQTNSQQQQGGGGWFGRGGGGGGGTRPSIVIVPILIGR